MKKRIKIYGVIAAAALVITALLASCFNPMDPSALSMEESILAPDGMVFLKLSFENPSGRTIMPVGYTKDDFEAFRLIISSSDSGTIPNGYAGPNGKLYEPNSPKSAAEVLAEESGLVLEAGKSYTFTVNAYMVYSGGADVVAANFTQTVDDIDDNVNLTIALKPVANKTGSGNFKYALTYNGATDFTGITFTMDIFEHDTTTPPDSGDAQSQIDITNGTNHTNSAGLVIPSGYWDVVISITSNDGNSLGIKYKEVLHIYPDMDSDWGTKNFNALTSILYNVTFHDTDDNGATATVSNYKHGDLLTAASVTGYNGVLDYATLSSGGFIGWYRETTHDNQWVENTTKLYRNTHLYGKWESIKANVASVTFNPTNKTLTFNNPSISISQDNLEASPYPTVTLTSDFGIGFDINNTKWIYSGGSGAEYPGATLNFSPLVNHDFLVGAPAPGHAHVFTVVVIVDGEPYSGELTIRVVESTP